MLPHSRLFKDKLFIHELTRFLKDSCVLKTLNDNYLPIRLIKTTPPTLLYTSLTLIPNITLWKTKTVMSRREFLVTKGWKSLTGYRFPPPTPPSGAHEKTMVLRWKEAVERGKNGVTHRVQREMRTGNSDLSCEFVSDSYLRWGIFVVVLDL